MLKSQPTINDIHTAAERIAPFAHRTPVLQSEQINREIGAQVFFKCENFQKVGAFKFRGGCNALFAIPDNLLTNGVATHSSGNHAQAIALAAKLRGTQATIVMPENAPKVKIEAVKGYGADIIFCEPTIAARQSTLDEFIANSGALAIHPYDHYDVIAGQGTCALEFIEEIPDLTHLIAPVGGGGLLSGTAISTKALSPKTRLFGAEPEQANDTFISFQEGQRNTEFTPNTIADGLRTSVGELTFPIIQSQVEAILTTSEKAIIDAMQLIWTRMKIIIEPSCAVPLACLMEKDLSFLPSDRVGIILTGGNVDLEKLPWM